ncbi:hypothetical protein [Asaia bogorensis]|uniref:Uncharacterized protein n=1 Tax=Asaia bogorensis NBRC 16594 TaxID=1231624 RepID=A0AAN4R452_9PROT|nr:hypothetical protein [Asaia bogorensis]GBQ81514.1 hypothetical protein AA0311_2636 [Asaia bogorensis NBRC 16594]GEL54843.1 hypothetical protein ABO01nite_28500 [Asaia bogorensis NBRC 16594]
MPVIFLVFGLLILMNALGLEDSLRPPAGTLTASLSDQAYGNAFLTYQAAVVDAVQQNGISGSSVAVAIPSVAGGRNIALPGAGNVVSQSGNTITIAVYAALTSSQLQATIAQSGGNATLGWARSGQWVSPLYGQMGPIPLSVPDRDAVSFIALNRN